MSTFGITTQQSQIYLGEQPAVTLYNEGPSTVYFDTNASVTPDSGFPLPPTGQMTWKSDQQLWAVTRLGKAKLYSNPFGGIADTSRAVFDQEIYRESFTTEVSTHETEIFETGFCESLILERDFYTGGFSFTHTQQPSVIVWYNDALEVTYEQTWCQFTSCTAPVAGDLDQRNYVTIPVRGRYCQIRFEGIIGDVTITQVTRVIGTNRVLPFQHWSGGLAEQTQLTALDSGVVTMNDFTIETRLPSWGRTLSMQYFGSVTTGGSIQIGADVYSGNTPIVGQLDLPIGTNLRRSLEVTVPTFGQLNVQPTGGLVVAANAELSFTWKEYNYDQ